MSDSIRLINREDDHKTIELITYEKDPDQAMLERHGRKVYRVASRRQITLGAAIDKAHSEKAMRDGKVEGAKNGAAWHPEKVVTKAEYKAILDGNSGSVVKGWLDNDQIAIAAV